MISISINSGLFHLIPWLEKKLLILFPPRDVGLAAENNFLYPDIIVVGFGPIGKEVYRELKLLGFTATVIEQNIDTVSKLEHRDFILFGDATQDSILKAAHIEFAHILVITVPNTQKALEIIHTARHINPNIEILTRVKHVSESIDLSGLNVHKVCGEEEELKVFITLLKKILRSFRKNKNDTPLDFLNH